MDPIQLAEGGGWAVVVAMLAAIGLGVVKGWWVPGVVYRREVRRGDVVTEQLGELTQAVRALAEKRGKTDVKSR